MDQDRFDQDYEKFSGVDANLSPAGISKYLANYNPTVPSKDAVKTSTENNPPIEKLKSEDPVNEPEDYTPPAKPVESDDPTEKLRKKLKKELSPTEQAGLLTDIDGTK